MALITLPTKFGFSRIERFGLTRRSNSLRSRYTGQGQTVIYPYAVWEFGGTLIEYDGLDAAAIRSFLLDLEGPKNTFQMPVPGYVKPSTGYTLNGVARVKALARTNKISVTGLTPLTNIIKKGEFITINDELKVVSDDYNSTSTGNAFINFKPALRKNVEIDTPIIFQNPYCLMRATEDDVASWSIAAPTRQNSNFEAIEAVDI